ncbi:hypothetical protein [Cohnella sp. GCM10012308]|uniref:hypothetical protein n=1 Tax=Cohnella sp. GCM10012308 TaxID=3317329 RepID=UPI003617BBCB
MSVLVPTEGDKAVPPVGRLLLTQEDLILEADAEFCRLFGFMPHALAGVRFESILTRASQILYQLHFSPSLRLNGKTERVRFALKSGRAEAVQIVVSASVTLIEEAVHYEFLVSPDR